MVSGTPNRNLKMVDQISKHELETLRLKNKFRTNVRVETLYTGCEDVYIMEGVGHVKICPLTEKELVDSFKTLPVMGAQDADQAIEEAIQKVSLKHEKIQKALIKLTREEIEALGISHLVQA